MDVDHLAELGDRHLGEALVAQDAGVVDEDVDASPVRHRTGDHLGDPRLVGHRSGKTDRLAAGRRNLAGNGFGSTWVHVVDNDFRTEPRQHQGMRPTKPAAGAGNDRDTPSQDHSTLSGLRFPFYSLTR